MRLGVVSDTHGTLDPSIGEALAGVDRIIHAGDIGPQHIIDELAAVAPVTAVRGNMDSGDLGWRLLDTATVRVGEVRILVTHRAGDAIVAGIPEGVTVVVSGHTHRPAVERIGEVLFVNPGSAGGHNRDGHGPTAAIIDLDVDPPAAWIIEFA
ncbi:MAG: metallophosphoesterase family protein [Coriobacteriia bacterium]